MLFRIRLRYRFLIIAIILFNVELTRVRPGCSTARLWSKGKNAPNHLVPRFSGTASDKNVLFEALVTQINVYNMAS